MDINKFEYIKEQLIYIKTKVDVDNQLSLYDINILSEYVFMNILNDVYDLNLKNKNSSQANSPAVDLVDERNKIIFQVTSTTGAKKVRETIEKVKKDGIYTGYKLKFFYLKEKPKFPKVMKEFESEGLEATDLIDIVDILKIIASDSLKCDRVYDTIKQHLENISFDFNIKNYFANFEPHLENISYKKFNKYDNGIYNFINSEKKILDIHAVGGNGKSHFLRHIGLLNTEYIPLIFRKQVNIKEDLQKLSTDKKYLLIFDDIDRFLDSEILNTLLSYTISSKNVKLLLSYRTASKNIVKEFYRKFNILHYDTIELLWSDKEIMELIKTLNPSINDATALKLQQNFNNNPYLITQAIHGALSSVQDFSLQIILDTQTALKEFNLNDSEINNILFTLALVSPIHEQRLKKLDITNIEKIVNKLHELKIIRKLSSKYRFNPDIHGDLYLSYFIEEYKNDFENIVERYLYLFSQTVFTNLSYALSYSKNSSLTDFLNQTIKKWMHNGDYSAHHLQLIDRVVSFVPEQSFMYLMEATKVLKPQENNHIRSGLQQLVTSISIGGDFNQDKDSINLGSIEPIISKLIFMLKNDIDCGEITIKDILNYLTSDVVLNLPKPTYDNHTLKSILSKLFSPLRTKNFSIILEAIDIAKYWIEEPLNEKKYKLFDDVVIKNLLGTTFNDSYSEGITYYWQEKTLNIDNENIQNIVFKVKDIVLDMFNSKNEQLLYIALDSIGVNAYNYNKLNENGKKFYALIKEELLEKTLALLEHQDKLSFNILSKIDNLAIYILKYDNEKNRALNIIKEIKRSSEYIFYQLVKNEEFIIIDYDKFYEEYITQENKQEWLFKSQQDRRYSNNLDEDFLNIIRGLSQDLNDEKSILSLLNSLNMNEWGAYGHLLFVLNVWFDCNAEVLIKIYKNHFQEIESDIIKNVFKELALQRSVVDLSIDDINSDISDNDLYIFLSVIFKDFNESRFKLVDKFISVIENKESETIQRYISDISSKIYFQIKDIEKPDLCKKFEPFIIRLLKLQFKNSFQFGTYLTFSLNIFKPLIGLSSEIIDILKNTVEDEIISIDHHELTELYRLLDFGLKEVVENLYKKLISKNEDGFYRYYFHNYFDHDSLTETLLLKEYIKSYDDFIYLTKKTYEFYNQFTEYADEEKTREIKIDLDWFFKYNINEEYLKLFFNELHKKYNLDKIKVFYKIVPISLNYKEIIVKNLNILQNHISDEKLMNYLEQMGKIKLYSRAHMQNSPEVLSEEDLFTQLLGSIESLSLRLKIKDKLKYIELDKRREIESDIELLLSK
jgi:hypothetical protein